MPGPAQCEHSRNTEFGMKEDDAQGVRVGKSSTWRRRPGTVPTSREASKQKEQRLMAGLIDSWATCALASSASL